MKYSLRIELAKVRAEVMEILLFETQPSLPLAAIQTDSLVI